MNASCVCVFVCACGICKLQQSMKPKAQALGHSVRGLVAGSPPRNYLGKSIHANDGLEY